MKKIVLTVSYYREGSPQVDTVEMEHRVPEMEDYSQVGGTYDQWVNTVLDARLRDFVLREYDGVIIAKGDEFHVVKKIDILSAVAKVLPALEVS
jgi:hypothetical protein